MVNFHTSSATVIVKDVQLWSEWREIEDRYKVMRYLGFCHCRYFRSLGTGQLFIDWGESGDFGGFT